MYGMESLSADIEVCHVSRGCVVNCDAATEAFKPTTYVYMGMCSEWND